MTNPNHINRLLYAKTPLAGRDFPTHTQILQEHSGTIGLPIWIKPVFNNPTINRTYAIGSRNTAKSKSYVLYALLRIQNDWMPGSHDHNNNRLPTNTLFFRQTMKSLEDSLKPEVMQAIHMLGWEDQFKETKSKDLIIHIPTRSRISFVGLENAMKTNSTKGLMDIRNAIGDEADTFTKEALEMLEPTIERMPGYQLHYISNTTYTHAAYYQAMLQYQELGDPNVLTFDLTFRDNPFINDKTLEAIASHEIRDPESWERVWNGKPHEDSDFIVFREGIHWHKSTKWELENHIAGFPTLDDYITAKGLTPMYGLDFGMSDGSPAVIVELYRIEDPEINAGHPITYISNTRHHYGLEHRYLPALIYGSPQIDLHNWENPYGFTGLIDPDLRGQHILRGDKDLNAHAEIRRAIGNESGTEIADKGPDSVLKGIKNMQDDPIIINDTKINPNNTSSDSPLRCEIAFLEAPHYKWTPMSATEKDVPNKAANPKKKHDNFWDACRYIFELVKPIVKTKPEIRRYIPRSR